MVQALRHQALTAEALVWTKVILVRSVVDIVTLEQVSLQVFQLSLVGVILLTIHTFQSPTLHILQFGVNVIKQNTDIDTNKNFIYFPNGRYIDCLSLTYATNKNKTLKLQYRY